MMSHPLALIQTTHLQEIASCTRMQLKQKYQFINSTQIKAIVTEVRNILKFDTALVHN